MSFDNATLFNVLLVQSLLSALLLALLMGTRLSPGSRWALGCMGLQALGWLGLAASGRGEERLGMSLAVFCLSASLTALWMALQQWLVKRKGQSLMLALPPLLTLVYALQYESEAFRVGWAHYGIAFQLLMVAASAGLPYKRRLMSDEPETDNRRWRALLLLAMLPMALICLLRGSLGAFGQAPHSPLDAELVNTLLALLSHGALLLVLLTLVLAWRAEAEDELARLAQTDTLTGLIDRRAFGTRAIDMISVARRFKEPLALMILDIDQLKAINEAQDRHAGDRALALFGSCVQAQMRLGDVAGRVGGEEFAVLMARADAQGPAAMDRRMREALAARAQAELGFSVDFSAGWARLRPGDRNIDDLMRRAEIALYEAKKGGRGKLVAEPGLEDLAASAPA